MLSLASYNIHGCIGRDGRFDLPRTIRVLKELDADVIALQEVDSRSEQERETLQRLADATGLTPISGPLLRRPGGHYGNGLLVRHEVIAVRRIDLSYSNREPRGALDVDLRHEQGVLRVIATHLGLLPHERRNQVRTLLSALEGRQSDITALLGDINEWFLWGRPLRWLHRHFGRGFFALPTFPSRLPLLALDRIWIEPRPHRVSLRVLRSHTARRASDHLPLRVGVEW